MKYEDFMVEIGRKVSDGYSVRVLNSPAGVGESTFELPWSREKTAELLDDLGCQFRSLRRREAPAEWESASTCSHSPEVIGARLYSALFKGDVGRLFHQSLGSLGAESNTGLRIKIKINPRHPEVAWISSLPWELLYRAETREFLSISRLTPVVRSIDAFLSPRPAALQSSLKILVIGANPSDRDSLDLELEYKNIRDSLRPLSARLKIYFLDNPSVFELRDELLRIDPQVLHYMGHGDFDTGSGRGVLILRGENGGSEAISGEALAKKIQDIKGLRLVFLNACDTARSVDNFGVNPFAGVASALIVGGVASVIAMQFPVSDEAAIAFSRAFYQRVAKGDLIDAAVVEGRKAVDHGLPRSLEWATPVLFLQGRSDVRFVAPLVSRPEPKPGQRRKRAGWPIGLAFLLPLSLCLHFIYASYWGTGELFRGESLIETRLGVKVLGNKAGQIARGSKSVPRLVIVDLHNRSTNQSSRVAISLHYLEDDVLVYLVPGVYSISTLREDVMVYPSELRIDQQMKAALGLILEIAGRDLEVRSHEDFEGEIFLLHDDEVVEQNLLANGFAVFRDLAVAEYILKFERNEDYQGLELPISVGAEATRTVVDFLPSPVGRKKARHRLERPHSIEIQGQSVSQGPAMNRGQSRANYRVLVRAIEIGCEAPEREINVASARLLIEEVVNEKAKLAVLPQERLKLVDFLEQFDRDGCAIDMGKFNE